jgi:hypothetical protein
MSPLSSSRKKKNKGTGSRGAGSRGAGSRGDGIQVPQPEDVFRDIIRGYRDLVEEPNPLEVEVYTSTLLGSLWSAARINTDRIDTDRIDEAADDESADNVIAALISFAGSQRSQEALALLRGFEAVAELQEQREAAGAAAAEVAARGVPEPPWSGQTGQVTPRTCWSLETIYGEDVTLLSLFDSPSGAQAVVTLLDYSDLDGWVPESFVVNDPAEALDVMREDEANSEGFARLREISPAAARELIEEGIAGTDQLTDVTPGENFVDFRALTLARCRAMPLRAPREPVPEQHRADLVAEFLASADAAHLPNEPDVAELARSIVDFGCEEDRGQPERLSPTKLDILLDELAFTDDQDDQLITDVLLAWTRWIGARHQLPEEAVDELLDVIENGGLSEDAEETLELIMEGLLAEGPSHSTDSEELREAVERRMFAMPFCSTRIGEEDYPELDPNDPDHRRLMVIGSHPEFHSILDDPFAEDVEINGVDPRTWLAVEETIVNQLWHDDPPEAWAAVTRLRELGLDRAEILARLASVFVPNLRAALTEVIEAQRSGSRAGQPAGMADYVRALDQLGVA